MADMSLRAMDLVDFEVEVDPWQGMWGLDLPKRENDSEVIQDPWLMGGIDVPKIERKQNPPSVDDIACPTTPEHLLSTQYQNGRNPAILVLPSFLEHQTMLMTIHQHIARAGGVQMDAFVWQVVFPLNANCLLSSPCCRSPLNCQSGLVTCGALII